MTTITIPAEYSYVLAVGVATGILNYWHGIEVGGARKAAKVPYPNCYATAVEAATSREKYEFNCAQRAHANFLEALPSFLVFSAITGLEWPVATAAMGATWVVGRLVYALAYRRSTREAGRGRYWGSAIYQPISYALMGMAITKVSWMVSAAMKQ